MSEIVADPEACLSGLHGILTVTSSNPFRGEGGVWGVVAHAVKSDQ